MAQTTFSGPVKSDNGFIVPAYTVATAPAVPAAGTVIYVTNGLAGLPCLAVSDGTNWVAPDGSAISAA